MAKQGIELPDTYLKSDYDSVKDCEYQSGAPFGFRTKMEAFTD